MTIAPLGCSDPAPPPASAPARAPLRVFATTRALADLVGRVGGRGVSVSWAAEGGRPLPGAGVAVDDATLRASSSADLVVGGRDAPWATAGFDDPFRGRRVIRADLLTGAPPGASPWLDPTAARGVARAVATRLSILRPADAERFDANLAALSADLDALAAEADATRSAIAAATRAGGGGVPTVVVFGDDFGAVLSAVGVRSVLFDGVPTDLSAPDVARLRRLAGDAGASAVAVPADLTPAALDDLSSRTGLRVVALDALGSPADGRAGYFDVVRYDLRQLRSLADGG